MFGPDSPVARVIGLGICLAAMAYGLVHLFDQIAHRTITGNSVVLLVGVAVIAEFLHRKRAA